MTARPSVPPIRRRENPLFSDTTPEPAAPVKNRQVMIYMPPGMLAEVDSARAGFALHYGQSVDRSALVRAAIRIAQADPDMWRREAMVDE